MPNITKILSPLEELLSKLPAGSKTAQEAIAAEMAARKAAQEAAYAPHTLPTETGAQALEKAKKTLGKADGGPISLDELLQKAIQNKAKGGVIKMAKAGLVGEGVEWLAKSLRGARAAEAAEELARLRPKDVADITAKKAKPVPPPAPRVKPKSKEEIHQIAERVAPQLTGEFVRKVGKTENVAGKSRKQWELEKELQHEMTRSRDVPEVETLSLEPHKGSVMLSLPGDTSIADFDIHSIGGIGLREPSRQYGGPRFGLGHPEEAGWASGLDPAGIFQRRVTESSKQYGDVPVLANYMAMGPEGMNYALHYSDALLKSIDPTKMTARNIDHTNRIIRAGNPAAKIPEAPDFPGIEHPEAAYLYLAENPATRKHFNAVMQLTNTTEALGLPSGLNVRHAITEPELRDLERGMTGYSLLQMEPGVTSLKPSAHPTYSHDIPGKFLGRTEVQTPYELTFPDTVAQIRANPKQAGSEFGTLQMGGGRQIIDQQLLDEIAQYRERIKQLTGKAQGGLAEGGVPEKRDVSQLFPLKVPADNAELKPEPKYPLLEKAAKGIQAAHEFVSSPFGYDNPPAQMLSDLLGVPDVAKTIENIAYDMPTTTGAGQATKLRPETEGAVMAVAPFAPELLRGAKTAAKTLAPTAAEMALDLAEKGGSPVRQFVVPPSEVKAGKAKVPANKSGFYNPAEKAALNLQRKKGTGDSFISDLKKQPGVNDERIAELGLDQFKGKPDVTNADIYATARENRIPLEESVRRERDEAAIEELERRHDEILEYKYEAEQAGDRRSVAEYEDELQENIAEQRRLKGAGEARFSPTHYPQYNMPGGTDYREIRVTAPKKEIPIDTSGWKVVTNDENKFTGQRSIAIYDANSNLLSQRSGFRGNDEQAIESAINDRKKIANKDNNFYHQAHHGDEPDVLFHIRGANHVDAEGKKGFLIDELQSDWHQQGREKGYRTKENMLPAKPASYGDIVVGDEISGWGKVQGIRDGQSGKEFDVGGLWIPESKFSLDKVADRNVGGISEGRNKQLVPDAPFKDNWYQLGLKRAIKEAADTGMDRVYLTTGERQADRYDLSKQIGSLSIKPKPNNMVSINAYKDGEVVIMKEVPKDQLADYIGKDMAKKAISDIDAGKNALYSDLDLKVGGEGMKQWYDKTYKNYLEKYAKQFGSKLGETKIQTELASNEWPNFRDWFEAKYPDLVSRSLVFWEAGPSNRYVKEFEKTLGKKYEPVYYIDITDAMRNSAKKGQSYAQGGAVRMADGGPINLDNLLAQAIENAQPKSLDHLLHQAMVKSYAEGGAAYNTNPDMSDGGQTIQGEAF